jgi:hypothetical protein
MVLVSAGLLCIYCVGAIAAPALASLLMRAFGPAALFAQAAIVHVAIAAFALQSLVGDARAAAKARRPIP